MPKEIAEPPVFPEAYEVIASCFNPPCPSIFIPLPEKALTLVCEDTEVREIPEICNIWSGTAVPIPTFPFANTLKYDVFDDDATLKISFVEPDTPRTLNAIVDDVALTPATVPLSISVPMPRVVADNQRDRYPVVPPDSDAVIPSDEVATHCVLVPVDQRN